MATVLKTCSITVGTADWSHSVGQVTIETNRDAVDVTGFQAPNKQTLAGVGDAQITMEIFNDYTSGGIDSQLFALSQSDVPVAIAVRPTSAAKGTANPEYGMTGLLLDYSPIDGAMGAASTTTVTFVNAGTAGLERKVS